MTTDDGIGSASLTIRVPSVDKEWCPGYTHEEEDVIVSFGVTVATVELSVGESQSERQFVYPTVQTLKVLNHISTQVTINEQS